MDVRIVVDDQDVVSMFTRVQANINRGLRLAMSDATILLLRDLRTYPPKPAASSYKRTGTLRRSWSREVQGEGIHLVGIVGSNANVEPYNRVVQDEGEQGRVHRGRWLTVQGVSRQRSEAIRRMFADRLAEATR